MLFSLMIFLLSAQPPRTSRRRTLAAANSVLPCQQKPLSNFPRMNTCKRSTKQSTSTTFRITTFRETPGPSLLSLTRNPTKDSYPEGASRRGTSLALAPTSKNHSDGATSPAVIPVSKQHRNRGISRATPSQLLTQHTLTQNPGVGVLTATTKIVSPEFSVSQSFISHRLL